MLESMTKQALDANPLENYGYQYFIIIVMEEPADGNLSRIASRKVAR